MKEEVGMEEGLKKKKKKKMMMKKKRLHAGKQTRYRQSVEQSEERTSGSRAQRDL